MVVLVVALSIISVCSIFVNFVLSYKNSCLEEIIFDYECMHYVRVYNSELQTKLKESEENRELKGKRINELMSAWSKIYDINVSLKEDNKDLHKYKELYLKALKELVTLQKNNEFDNLFILQKYVNYAGYKHLDIKFTKQEKLILKNLESCNKND